jgi:hypothetical protein
MEAAANYWNKPHDQVLFELCTEIVRNKMGEDCAAIVLQLSSPVEDALTLMASSKLDDTRFRAALTVLCQSGIVVTQPNIALLPQTIISMLSLPHYVIFAQKYYIIPQDKELIAIIVKKVIQAPTLSAQKIADTLATEDPSVDRSRVLILIQHLLSKNILYQTEDGFPIIVFNTQRFLTIIRKEALEKLVELQDHRVVEVVRALFDPDYKESVLVDCDNEHVDRDELVDYLCKATDMKENEVFGVLSILASNELCLISPDFSILQPRISLAIFKLKRVAALLSEIGYPLARRVINMLLKNDQIETVKFCDMMMMPKEEALILLEKLKNLGIIKCCFLEDANHTTLKRKYCVWRINQEEAINNTGSYLLAVLGALFFESENEKLENDEILKKTPELLASSDMQRRKVMEDRLTVLGNTMMNVIKRYIELWQL